MVYNRVTNETKQIGKLMRESIIAILILPFVLIALVGFYILIGIFILCAYTYSGIKWLFSYNPITPSEKERWKKILRLDGIDVKGKK